MRYINKTRFFALFFTTTLLFTLLFSYAETTSSDIADSVLRLHVIANSNSEADQQLKLKVRDRILHEASSIFCNTNSTTDALLTARSNTHLLTAIAEDEIRLNGFEYSVTVSVEETDFPTKFYNDITLPAGKYNAVRIEIGKAKGENWWCVMYPPLCFTNGICSTDDVQKSKLKNSLSPGEYKLITQKSTPVKIKFKIVEVFQKLF